MVANSPESMELATILVDANLSEDAVDNALAQMATAMFAQQPDLAALESAYPGVKQVFLSSLRPIIDDEMERIRPLYVADLAVLFGGKFNAAELKKLSAFWQSPPAQSVLRSAIQNVDYAAISTEIVDQINKDEDIAISQAAVDKDMGRAISNTTGSVGKAEQSAFLRFAMTPEGRKFLKLKEEKKAVDLKWMNAPTPPAVEKRIETAITAALERHIAEYDEREAAEPTT